MSAPSDLTLLDALLRSGRLSADQRAVAERLFAEFAADPVRLADELLSAKIVNKYQHRKIQVNRPQELVFGQYLIVERIGEGGMGKVYRAIETRLGREVALKTIRPNLLANKTVVQRYKREARAAAALTHPNIVELHEADDVNGRYFLAMEFVDGSDLARLIKDLQKEKVVMPPGEAAEYIRQAALGLQHAHDKELVHRDIKPSNLLVSGDRAIPGTGGKAHVKILDMGLVRSLTEDDDTTTDLTRDGTVVGTPDYMSPEQGKNSSTVDYRADIYSLGCTLFYLLRGLPPFDSGTAIDKLIRHQLDPVPDIRQHRPDVPPGLAAVIKKMMAKKPDERFQTCTDVARELALYTTDAAPFDFASPSPSFQAVDFALPAPAVSTTAETPPPMSAAPTPGQRSVRVIHAPPQAGPPRAKPVPKPTGRSSASMPAPPKQPTPGSLRAKPIARPPADATPAGLGSATTPRPPRSDPAGTATGSARRSPRKPPPKKRKEFPVVWVAVGGAAGVALIVVLAVLVAAGGNHDAPKPTPPEQARPTQPAPPVVVSAYRPVAELLPNETSAVLVCDPKEYWVHAGTVLDKTGPTRRQADLLARFFKFDPKRFDRVTVAFHADLNRCVAAGEGEVLKGDSFRRELDSYPLLETDAGPNGVTAVHPKRLQKNPWNPKPRVVLWPTPAAYFVASEKSEMGDIATNPKRTGPERIDPALLAAVADATKPGAPVPLLYFAASGDTLLPLKAAGVESLKSKGVDLLTVTATVLPDDKGVKVTLTLLGKESQQLGRFLEQSLPAMVERVVGGDLGREVADPLRDALKTADVTDANGKKQLTAEFTWKWKTVHEAVEKAVPAAVRAVTETDALSP